MIQGSRLPLCSSSLKKFKMINRSNPQNNCEGWGMGWGGCLKMFIVGKLWYKIQYGGWDINTEAALAKGLIETACMYKKGGFSAKISTVKCMPLLLLFYLSWSCLGVDEIPGEGSSGKKNQLSTKRIMGLHFQMLSFFMENNQKVCQKLGGRGRKWFAHFRFWWILLLLSRLSVSSQNVCRK